MNLIRKTGVAIVFVLALLPELGLAQYMHRVSPFWSNLSNTKRYEIGGGIIMPAGQSSGPVRALDGSDNYLGDTTMTRAATGSGFGGIFGLCLPFKATGHISCWAVAAQLQVNMFTWTNMNPVYKNGGLEAASKSLDAATMQVMLPIGIDWKVGNDAILTKRLTFATAFGAGVIPQIMSTSLVNVSGFEPQWGYGLTPYAKFDWAIFTGFCWKLRFMYTAGSINLLDVNHRIPGSNDGQVDLRYNSSFMASLIIMPFSGGWSETAYYNTYDTYNQHDRFN